MPPLEPTLSDAALLPMTELAVPTNGWARSSLERTLRMAVLAPVVGMHAMQAAALLLTSGLVGGQRFGMVGNVVAILLAAWMARDAQRSVWPLVALSYAMLFLGWAVAPDMSGIVAFTSAWLGNATVALGAFLLPRPAAAVVPPVMGVLTGLWILLPNPDWVVEIPLAAAFTPAAITLIGLGGRRLLEQLVGRAEDEAAEQLRARQRFAASRAAVAEATETARTLHDTVINTLGAIAGGGAALAKADLVRERCAADAEVTRRLLREGTEEGDQAPVLQGVGAHLGLTVTVTGAEAGSVEDWGARLSPAVRAALRGAVHEALLNVHKHAGVTEVEIRARRVEDCLVVDVADLGRGFDEATTRGSGLEESIRGRCADVGIMVTIASAPGAGTTVSLRCPPPEGSSTPRPSLSGVVDRAQRMAGLLWAGGVAVVGAMIELVNNLARPSLTWGRVGVLVGVVVLAWLTTRDGGDLPAWAVVVIVLSLPAVLVLSLGGVSFMDAENIHNWQALGVTGPAVVILYLAPTRRAFLVAVATTILSGVVATVILHAQDVAHATVVPFGVGSALAVLAAMAVFRRTMDVFGTRAAEAQESAHVLQVEGAARRAAWEARRRWRTAGLEASLTLLEEVASGGVTGDDDALRAACRREERHLRQLLLLSPELVHLGPWLSRVSAMARDRGVDLTMRTGDQDIADRRNADVVGQILLDAVLTAPPDASVTIGVFAQAPGPRVTLLVPAGPGELLLDLPTGWSAAQQSIGGRRLIELHPTTAEAMVDVRR